PRSPH
ncbi:branched-chain amino acid transport system II carrier protein, partial [Vibrio parahaemolyticus V-223/04]